jgi:hypothetical protein
MNILCVYVSSDMYVCMMYLCMLLYVCMYVLGVYAHMRGFLTVPATRKQIDSQRLISKRAKAKIQN